MKTLSIMLLITLVFLIFNACSHSTHIISKKKSSNINFTLEEKDFLKNGYAEIFQLHLSSNTKINIDLRSIADFVQPIILDQTPKLLSDEIEMHPWAFFRISF